MTQRKTPRAMMTLAVIVTILFLLDARGSASPLSSSPSTPPPVPDELPAPVQIRTAIEALRKGDADTAERVVRQFVTAQPGNALGHAVLGACRSNAFDDTATKNEIAHLAQVQRSRSDQYVSYPPKSTSEHFSDTLLG